MGSSDDGSSGSEVEDYRNCCPGCGDAGKKRCARCQAVKYCGPSCQKAHWRLHKIICGEKARLGPPPASRRYDGPEAAALFAYGEGDFDAAAAQRAQELLAMMTDPSVEATRKTRCFAADGPFAGSDAAVFAAGERNSPSVYEVAISMFKEDEDALKNATAPAAPHEYRPHVARSEYAVAILNPGAWERGGAENSGYRPESQRQRRAAALFANGGFLPFMRATRAVAKTGLEHTAAMPCPGGGPWCEASMTVPEMMMPLEIKHARNLLRWLCGVINSEAVGHAILRSAPWADIVAELQAMVDAVMDHAGDADAILDALLYVVLGHLDYWAQLPGLLPGGPRDLEAELELTQLQTNLFLARGRPCSWAQIAKGRGLSGHECEEITKANFYLLGHFLNYSDVL